MAVKFNPLTGLLGLVNLPVIVPVVPVVPVTPNSDRIVTHEYNMAGNKNIIYDPASKTYIEMGAQVVIDDNGNVVIIGK